MFLNFLKAQKGLVVLFFVGITLLGTAFLYIRWKRVFLQPEVKGTQTVLLRGSQIIKTPILRKKSELVLSGLDTQEFLVFDGQSGVTLAQKDPEKRRGIGSLTKLMTTLVVLESLDLRQPVAVDARSVTNIAPISGLKSNSKVLGQDLLVSMLVGSANDSALALAREVEKVTGKEISVLMNEKAKELRMMNSHFDNPVGFDSDNNYSTAEDLKFLVQECLKHGLFETISKTNNYEFLDLETKFKYKVRATNRLVAKYPEIEAIKTGNTPLSGGSLISQITKGPGRIIVIVLGSSQREKDLLLLKDSVFNSYSWED